MPTGPRPAGTGSSAAAAACTPSGRQYGIEVEGSSAHSSAIYLIDSRGYERTGYIYPTVAMRQLAADVRTLIRSG